jgi:hypothetical protein
VELLLDRGEETVEVDVQEVEAVGLKIACHSLPLLCGYYIRRLFAISAVIIFFARGVSCTEVICNQGVSGTIIPLTQKESLSILGK